MAFYTPEQAILLIKEPRNSNAIQQAAKLQHRIKLHAESIMDMDVLQAEHCDYVDRVPGRILLDDKLDAWKSCWHAPVETNELIQTIRGELSRVFSADDAKINHSFKDSESQADANQYLKGIKDEKYWQKDYWKAVFSEPESIMVVDLPEVQIGPRPEPYYYMVNIDSMRDYEVNSEGYLEYAIYWGDTPGVLIYFDDMVYRKYQVPFEEGMPQFDKAVQLGEDIFHMLGRNPGKPIYFDPVSIECPEISHNPFSRSLGNLDWLLFFEVSKKYLETYAPFPIYATYEEIDDYKTEASDGGEHSELREGLDLPDSVKIISTARMSDSKITANRRLLGVGTIQRYPAPRDKEDSDLLNNPVQVIPAEEVSLNYCDGQIEKRYDRIYTNCVGKGGDLLTSQAANQDQVQGTFQSKENVLAEVREKIEECRQYIYEVMFDLRYNPAENRENRTLYMGSDVGMGKEYYLTSVKDQLDQLASSRTNGLPVYELDNQKQAIFHNKYRDKPDMIARNEILGYLEPYPQMSLMDVQNAVGKGLADRIKYIIKQEFISFIQRFEREQMNIVEFASERPLQTKIDIINSKLIDYAKESDPGQQEPEPGAPAPGQPGTKPLPPFGG